MRYNSFRDPGARAADGGLFENELVLKPLPYEPAEFPDDDTDLRLDRAPEPERPVKRRRGPRRGVVMAGWAVVLGVALSIAYATQPSHELTGQPDLPPAPPPPTADEIGAPVTAAPIAADPSRFAQAQPTAESAPAPELQVAEAAPVSPPSATPPVQKAAQPLTGPAAELPADIADTPASVPVPPKPKPAAPKVETASAAVKAPETGGKLVKAAKTDDAEPSAHKMAVADSKALPELTARISRAYAAAEKAGAPKSVLKARQTEWLVLRAKAEKKGPQAVAALYRTRAAQLEALAKKSAAHTHGKV